MIAEKLHDFKILMCHLTIENHSKTNIFATFSGTTFHYVAVHLHKVALTTVSIAYAFTAI